MGARTVKTMYHATAFENLPSILDKGLELRNCEKLVYLCDKPFDCLKFAKLHGVSTVLVCKVKVKESDLIETFDHSEAFFQCRCWGSVKPIPISNIKEFTKYEI